MAIQKNFELNNTFKKFFIQLFHCDKEDRKSKEIITQELEEILDQMPKLSPEFVTLCEQLKGTFGEFLSMFYEIPEGNCESEGYKNEIWKIKDRDQMNGLGILYESLNTIIDSIVESHFHRYESYNDIISCDNMLTKCSCGKDIHSQVGSETLKSVLDAFCYMHRNKKY